MKSIISILLMLLSIASPAYTWNDEKTHPTLSEFAAEKYFGAEFMDTIVQGEKVRQWINDGSKLEDTGSVWQFLGGTARSLNHFHNASKATLAEARLTDVPSFMPIGGSTTWESTPLWAQDGDNQGTKVNGDWSWQALRERYYKSLTTIDKTTREAWQSDYLTGLGYQMHLIQDMGQPNHVRNDTHIWDGASLVMGLETWAKRKDNEIIKNQILANVTIPTVTVDLIAPFAADSTKAPVANLFDTRSYLGTRPPSAEFNQGLAEYTNANFFSENTVFASEYGTSDKHYQPYPRKNETNVQDYINEQMALTTITYDEDFGSFDTFVVKKQTTSGEPLNCLATSGPFSRKLYQEQGEDKYFYRSFMYDACFREYAEKLIPASVAYSKAMLEYFHRGKLEVSLSTQHPSTPTTIRFMVKNNTPNEAMTGGKLALVLRYKQMTETGNALAAPAADSAFTYQVIEQSVELVSSSAPTEYSLNLTQPLPFWTTELAAQIVYRGVLGNETDSAAVSPWIELQPTFNDIALSLPSTGVYATTSGTTPFGSIKMNARNNLPTGQTMTDGTVSLYLLYRTAKTDPFQSQQVTSLPETGYDMIKMTHSSIRSITKDTPAELSFNLSDAPFPLWATDVYLYIVYQGAVFDGTTTTPNATVFGMIDISEPTPVDVFNNADQICINNQWYTAGNLEAITLADSNGDGIPDLFDPYAHNIANIFTKASASDNATFASASNFTFNSASTLSGGNFRRLGYILTDYSFKYSNLEDWLDTDPADPWYTEEPAEMYSGMAVKNQDGVWPGMFTIRGKKMWWGAGVVYDNAAWPPDKDADSACGWDRL